MTTEETANASSRQGWIRLGLGLMQGLGLWVLHEAWEAKAWPATQLAVMGPLVLLLLFIPLILIAGLGRIRTRTLMMWTGGAAAVLTGLGVYDGLTATVEAFGERVAVSPVLVAFTAAGLFIAHNLVAAADHDRRRIAHYPTHFDLAWKHGVQLGLSLVFVGVFWVLLWLGAALFRLIGLEGFEKLLEQEWFSIPATFTAFAGAGHLTDVRVGLIRGVRTVALTLLSWLTPMMALIAVAFLAALPFTGLEPLWDTNAATASLLAAAAVMIVLVNAIHQGGDGDDEGYSPNVILRWAARAASVALVPVVGLAAYALSLRIGQYGLTPERIIAAACVLIGALHAGGYAFAAVKPGPLMKPLELTNVIAAYATLAVLIALFTPIADPARVSVDDQVGRLRSGKVTPERFDWDFLRFEARTHGLAALKRLARSPDEAVAAQAKAALARDQRTARAEPAPAARTLTAGDFRVATAGKALPADFPGASADAGELSDCGANDRRCPVVIEDFAGDGADEVLVLRGWSGWLYQREGARWRKIGTLESLCGDWERLLERGEYSLAEPVAKDLVIGGRRWRISTDEGRCAEATPGAAADSR